jgi:hypothetical protein
MEQSSLRLYLKVRQQKSINNLKDLCDFEIETKKQTQIIYALHTFPLQ